MGLCSSTTIKAHEKEAIEEAKKLAPLVIEVVKEKVIEADAKKVEAVIPAITEKVAEVI